MHSPRPPSRRCLVPVLLTRPRILLASPLLVSSSPLPSSYPPRSCPAPFPPTTILPLLILSARHALALPLLARTPRTLPIPHCGWRWYRLGTRYTRRQKGRVRKRRPAGNLGGLA
ncbi:uncharacterized protein SCHCODRAFT_02517717 [Schizophyllum commune H4-8]|nr:uncharacterized protein SCHCODRAFT_02517717 [Schizophyllum commune H4-8]KAI5886248.1 hypothetical protein SCHCODRAFT_02517717 [Schizophyllum commune H4-8]